MTRPFRPGDRIITTHPRECYNKRRGVLVRPYTPGSSTWLMTIENPSPEIISYTAGNNGLMAYGGCYLRHVDPLSPFDAAVQDYITSELTP